MAEPTTLAQLQRPARPAGRSDLRVQELDGEAVLYDPITRDTHYLNATALAVWQACDGQHSARDIARQITARYDVSLAEALPRVDLVLRKLHGLGLLRAEPAPPRRGPIAP